MNPEHHLALYLIAIPEGMTFTREQSRSAVTQIIKEYLSTDSNVFLDFDSYGKPYIRDHEELMISYTHSKTLLVVALCRSMTGIGIDTENTSRLQDIRDMQKFAFSTSEISNLNDSELITLWCLKEAAVKRLGTGFRDAEPAEFTVKKSGKSYTLYLGNDEKQTGHFINMSFGEDAIVVCVNKHTENLSLAYRTVKDIQIKEPS
jgi:phosphopantetheinyl transferase